MIQPYCPFCKMLFDRTPRPCQPRTVGTPACEDCIVITCGDSVEKVKADIEEIDIAFDAWLAEPVEAK